ncbi:MAG TPA: hypothetical protein VJT83_04755 [Chitinophagaceae bacterium]|nr:hypothetical protein [Chitinophagaceae bacterium]
MKQVVRIVVILMTAIIPMISNAQSPVEPIDRKASLTFVGTKDESSIILLEVKNDKAEKFNVVLLQKNGSVLYKESFSDKKVTKRFFIPRDIVADVKIVVADEKDKNREEFQLNSRFVEEIYFSKS